MKQSTRDEIGVVAIAAWIAISAVFLTLIAACGGCKSFYENGGSAVRVGTMNAPIELSDGSDSFACKLLYSMDGAYAYTRKDSKVRVAYQNVYTNNYVGCVETRGQQHLEVEVEPLYVGGEGEAATNAAACACGSAGK